MKGVDLRLFQFDYDQSWAVFFLNADGTIYGRYGTRGGDKKSAATYISMASFKNAMKRALDLHQAYPGNRDQLAGKLGPTPPYAVPEQIPGLKDRAATATTQKNCIHCHMVAEHVRKLKYQERRLSPADIWVFPLPENAGLKLNVEDGLRVESVIPNSAAARAGLEPGDDLMAMNGQPLISQADVQWILHTASVETQIAVTLKREGKTLDQTLTLGGKWKESDLSWRETSWSFRPGLWTIPLPDAEKIKHGIPSGSLALSVKWVFGRPPLAKQAGLRDGDIIVAVDGLTAPMDESHFLSYVRLHHPPGGKVRLTLRRGEQKQEVLLPVE